MRIRHVPASSFAAARATAGHEVLGGRGAWVPLLAVMVLIATVPSGPAFAAGAGDAVEIWLTTSNERGPVIGLERQPDLTLSAEGTGIRESPFIGGVAWHGYYPDSGCAVQSVIHNHYGMDAFMTERSGFGNDQKQHRQDPPRTRP